MQNANLRAARTHPARRGLCKMPIACPRSCFPTTVLHDAKEQLKRRQRKEVDALKKASEQKRREVKDLRSQAYAMEKSIELLKKKHDDEMRELEESFEPDSDADDVPDWICCICHNFWISLEKCARCARWVCESTACRSNECPDSHQIYCRMCFEVLMADPKRRCEEAFREGEGIFCCLRKQKCGAVVSRRNQFLHSYRCNICSPIVHRELLPRSNNGSEQSICLPRHLCVYVNRLAHSSRSLTIPAAPRKHRTTKPKPYVPRRESME